MFDMVCVTATAVAVLQYVGSIAFPKNHMRRSI